MATDPVPLSEWRARDPAPVSTGQTINVGYYLRERLERAARGQGYDATGLARAILRDYVEQHDMNGGGPH